MHTAGRVDLTGQCTVAESFARIANLPKGSQRQCVGLLMAQQFSDLVLHTGSQGLELARDPATIEAATHFVVKVADYETAGALAVRALKQLLKSDVDITSHTAELLIEGSQGDNYDLRSDCTAALKNAADSTHNNSVLIRGMLHDLLEQQGVNTPAGTHTQKLIEVMAAPSVAAPLASPKQRKFNPHGSLVTP